MTDGLDLFHVPPPDFKFRCETHLCALPDFRAADLTATTTWDGFRSCDYEHPQAHGRVGV